MNFIFVYTTFPTRKEAEKVRKYLLEKKMLACAIIYPVNSSYWWKSKIENQKEWIFIGKTTEDNFEKIKNEIEKLHSYEIPYIAKIKLEELNEKYRNWFIEKQGGIVG